jgi:hypothetical protein
MKGHIEFNLDYAQALELYNAFNHSATVIYSMQAFKAILLIFGMIKAIQLVSEAAGKPFSDIVSAWQLKEWFKFLWVPMLLGSYDFIIDFLDQLGLLIDQEYAYLAQKVQSMEIREEITSVDSKELQDTDSFIMTMSSEIVQFLSDPTYFVFLVFEALANFLDWVMFGVILLERFFLLWILKIFGGFAIAALMLQKFEDWFYKWIKMYFAYFMLIIPYLAINFFCNKVYRHSLESYPEYVIGGGAYGTAILILVVILKLKLFKSSTEVVKSIFQ